MRRTTSAKDLKIAAKLRADLEEEQYRSGCFEEAARLRKKAGIHQDIAADHPTSVTAWDRKFVKDLKGWADAAEKEARR
jgi:hypothetical protein